MVQAGEMQAGDLFSFIIYTGIIGGAIAGIGNLYSTLAGSIGATERIQDILDRDEEISNTQLHAESHLKLQGEIRFEGVTFSYPSRPDVTVLRDISLNVKKGERIALVGQSGAGKSTIAQLVMRFYKPTAGSILIDGQHIDSYDLLSFRKNLAIVPQDVLLFGGTIRENILYGKPGASDEELKAAAEQSNCMEFISGFPDGFETVVGERGIKLSGGQKQRIAIARSILRDPAILILDEATSSLDSESEKIVQDALDKLMKNRTSIIIAHRLSTIRDADRIYVLKDGLIAESGTHSELIAMESGIYRSLVSLQMEKESFSLKTHSESGD